MEAEREARIGAAHGGAALKDLIVAELEAARMRTLGLVDPLPEEELERQHSPIMSPLVWDLAHIAYFEELWLLRRLGEPGAGGRFGDLYDAFRHSRSERGSLEILRVHEARAYLADVRGRVLETLERVDLDADDPLLAGGFVYGMIVQHELQHGETMLQTLQLAHSQSYPPVEERSVAGAATERPEALIEGGSVELGTDAEAWAYDNERPAHRVEVAPFRIDTRPVTNEAYAAFIADGGYARRELWRPEGWALVAEERLAHPLSWRPEGRDAWSRMRFGRLEALPPDEPVQHVSWYEADAYARWAGRRLPSEAEWETAATWAEGEKRRSPWGDASAAPEHANLGAERFAPLPAGALPAGESAAGVRGLVGDVWEWTGSTFRGYPGFRAFPYREYSEAFFGDEYRVLRGGSWATHPLVARATFRNWDYPIRRQLFAGFRCARDA